MVNDESEWLTERDRYGNGSESALARVHLPLSGKVWFTIRGIRGNGKAPSGEDAHSGFHVGSPIPYFSCIWRRFSRALRSSFL
jgi:hypothetical protein